MYKSIRSMIAVAMMAAAASASFAMSPSSSPAEPAAYSTTGAGVSKAASPMIATAAVDSVNLATRGTIVKASPGGGSSDAPTTVRLAYDLGCSPVSIRYPGRC